ncbi:MAG: sigma-54 factor interaction domain-containing protein, partial [Deltaproteobacteria bacterium]|nr:sigma-54 factor interaction domain-containing protein [Deltaproteobacteria bacterium]
MASTEQTFDQKAFEEKVGLEFVGSSSAIHQVFEAIQKVADTDSTVLISGESGTGKELVARAIHNISSRRNAPLIPVNCGAIPSELLESELFGHVKGSFTGAISNRQGRFELAQNGSIFLDEIGDMPPMLQVKILRVLQERRFEPVGGMKTLTADVRIIAA